jgi:mannose-6-phosphate isomerase-like protein (cupin superfamily)
MDYSRRDLRILLPALTATVVSAQGEVLASKALRSEDLPVRVSANMRSRAILKGETHSKFPVDLHSTELAAGPAPHPPHRHAHEEILLVKSGTVTVNIAGKTTELGAGSVAYIASNEEHGWRNTGTTYAQYFVLALGNDK